MPETISIEEAQAHLSELIARLIPGEEVWIMQDERPVAKLVSQPQTVRQPRQPGSAQGRLIIHADDEDHLRDFTEYMP